MKNTVQKNAIKVVGIELRTSNLEAMQTIPPLWERFFKEGIMQKISHKVSDDIYAVYRYSPWIGEAEGE